MTKSKKTTEILSLFILLRQKQQKQLMLAINNLKQRKQELVKEIQEIDDKLYTNEQDKRLYISNFYANLANITFTNKEFNQLAIYIKKFEKRQEDLDEEKDELVDNLQDVEYDIEGTQNKLNHLIKQESKYIYIKNPT